MSISWVGGLALRLVWLHNGSMKTTRRTSKQQTVTSVRTWTESITGYRRSPVATRRLVRETQYSDGRTVTEIVCEMP